MSGTLRTVNFLLTQQAQDGQTPGSYTLSRQRDFIQTMNARTGGTYGTFVRVTDPEFNGGADPTGVNDSTLAFQQAMAAGVAIVPAMQPNGTPAIYAVANCIVPSESVLIGFSAPMYTFAGTAGQTRPQIVPFGAPTVMFNVNGTADVRIAGLCIVAFPGVSGISGGSSNMHVEDTFFNQCDTGIVAVAPGASGFGSGLSWSFRMRSCNFLNCLTGLGDLLDSFIFDCTFTNCQNGTSLLNGPATFIGCTFESCGRTNNATGVNGPLTVSPGGAGYGAKVNGCTGISFLNSYFQVNGNAGIQLSSCTNTQIQGCKFTANGSNVTVSGGHTLIATSSHIEFAGPTTSTLITGCTSYLFAYTYDGANFSPAFFCYFGVTGGANTKVNLIGNDVSGVQGSTAGTTLLAPINSNTTWRGGTAPSGVGSFYTVKTNIGTGTTAQDVDTR